MSDRAFRRLGFCLLTPLRLAASAATTQAQDSTQTRTLQPRPQPIELQRITGILFRGDTATPAPGFEFVKQPDNSVAVRRTGSKETVENVTCVCKEGSGTCNTVVQIRDGRIAGYFCEARGCARCDFERKPVQQLRP